MISQLGRLSYDQPAGVISRLVRLTYDQPQRNWMVKPSPVSPH